jgi:hypothetical protein
MTPRHIPGASTPRFYLSAPGASLQLLLGVHFLISFYVRRYVCLVYDRWLVRTASTRCCCLSWLNLPWLLVLVPAGAVTSTTIFDLAQHG